MNKIYDKLLKVQEQTNSFVTILKPEEIKVNPNKDLPLADLNYVAKDNFNTIGIKTTASSNILGNYIPVYNATVINKLNNAGATLLGKTSMDELGMGGTNLSAATGPVYNPWDLTRIPGGSSGGSAAVMATGTVDFALGTDTGDSIRKPAGYTGVIGVKPTYGRVSRYGVIPYASSMDHIGYFTSNVNNAAKILKEIAGFDPCDMTSSHTEVKDYTSLLDSNLKGKKIALIKNIYDLIAEQTIKDSLDNLIKELELKGSKVDFVTLNEELLRSILPTYLIIVNSEASANHSNLDGLRFGVSKTGEEMTDIMINSRTTGLSYNIRKRFVFGSYGLFEENQKDVYTKAQQIRRLVCDEYFNKTNEYDAVINVSNLHIAPKVDDINIDELNDEYLIGENHLVIANFNGYPSMTLPLCFSNNMPIGLNITTKPFMEEEMFNIGLAIEEITKLKDLVAKGDK